MFDRLLREKKTMACMLRMYCRAHHEGGRRVCNECRALAEYADQRLARCPYGEGKPTCASCPIHCYRREQRELMRQVMRWAGPRMLLRHPLLAVLHLLDGRREVAPPPSVKDRSKESALRT